jgi:aryl-alcohol dehydrogenase-like predicted oxidoreductase
MKYKLFGRSGLRVSEMALGTMTFGTEWGWGAEKSECKKMFTTFAKAGGNFIDTANRYTEGSAERILGELIKGDRDHFVIGSKYTLYDRLGDPNYSGNHRKNMMRSVEGSLKRLDTGFLDILWVHAWDFFTPHDEVMRGLDDLVSSGKVHYLGVSDPPAWVVSRCNTLAELRGWAQFVGLQVEYSLLQRSPERDLLPMAREMGLAVTPWAPLAGGALSGKYLKGQSGRVPEHSKRRSEENNRIVELVVREAKKLGCTPSQLALKWTMQQDFVGIPLIGASRAAQVDDAVKAVLVDIPAEVMLLLDQASQIDLGFPHDFLRQEATKTVVYGGTREWMRL